MVERARRPARPRPGQQEEARYDESMLGGVRPWIRSTVPALLGASLALVTPGSAQAPPNSERPEVALVLSGGGARGGSLEAGQVWQTRDSPDIRDLRPAARVILRIHPLLGPLYLSYGWSQGGSHTGYLSLGRTF